MGLRSNTNRLSSASGVDSDLTPAFSTTPSQQATIDKASEGTSSSFNKTQGGLLAARSGAEILNAVLEFEQIDSKARMNIMFANMQFHESLGIGRSQALQAESQGFARGEQAVLSAIAQGQEASGGIAQSSQLAEETLGILNAIAIENNAIREAYGFKREAALIEHERNLAEIQRNANIFTSALSGAAAASTFV